MPAPELLFLGTGTAFHADGRGSQSILVSPPGTAPFLVDFGPTAMGALMREGLDYSRLERLFITHLHGDHTAGWPFLLLNLIFLHGRTRPFDVHGPRGTRRCLEGLAEHCYAGILDEGKRGFEVRYHELEIEEAAGIEADGLRFDVLPMEHHPSSLAYRFHLDGTRVAVSGDTRWCVNLEKLAAGSDVVVLECSSVEAQEYAHLSLAEIREGIDRLGTSRLVLVHLTDEVAADLARNPVPRVIAAHDGMAWRPPGL